YNAKFSDSTLTEEMKKLLYPMEGNLAVDLTEEQFVIMQQDFERLCEECENAKLGREIVIRAGLEQIIIQLLRMHEPHRSKVGATSSSAVNRALTYIRQHYIEALTLDSVASYCNV